MNALEQAIQKAGGVAALASGIDVAASSPSMWKKRKRVPAEHCPAIERLTGVRCEDLRPDVEWSVLRGPGELAANEPQPKESNHE